MRVINSTAESQYGLHYSLPLFTLKHTLSIVIVNFYYMTVFIRFHCGETNSM